MRPIIIGVAGGTGSGKSSVVRALVQGLASRHVAVIQHDSYYRDRSHLSPAERENINYDHPDALESGLLGDHLYRLLEGHAVEVPIYDFTTHTRKQKTTRVEPEKVIIVDGILILAGSSLKDIFDIRIFIATDDDVRLIRRLQRDVSERGRTAQSVIQQYLNTVKPMHLQFVEPSRRHADIIIPEGGQNRIGIDMLTTKISSLIAGSSVLSTRHHLCSDRPIAMVEGSHTKPA